MEKAEKSGQLSAEVKKCIQNAQTLEDIETLASQFKTAGQQTLAARARSIPNLEATAQNYLQPDAKNITSKCVFYCTVLPRFMHPRTIKVTSFSGAY